MPDYLPESPRETILHPSAGTTEISWDFELTEEAGLEIRLFRAGAETVLVNGVDYDLLSGIGDDDGGTATLTEASLADDEYILQGDLPIVRTNAFSLNGKLPSDRFNADFDRLYRAVMELARNLGYALKQIGRTGGFFDASNKRIGNVADAVNDGDAVNKGQITALTAAEIAAASAQVISDIEDDRDAAAASASAAATSADNASDSEDNAQTSADAAAAAKTGAENARDSALAAFDNFDDKYLGAKAADPTVDNDGDPLVAGQLYFNTVSNAMLIYEGSAWVAAYVSDGGFIKADGTVPMSGNFNAGGNNITNVGTVDGRDVSGDGTKLDAVYKVNKLDATAAPTANDDSANTSGNGVFSIGSRWIDVTGDQVYECVDVTPTAAVWKNLSTAASTAGYVDVVSTYAVDNTGATDASGDLQSAITAISTAGLIAYIPPGTYDLDDADITVPDGGQVVAAPTAVLQRSADPSSPAPCINLGSDCTWTGGHIQNTLGSAHVNSYNCGISISSEARSRILKTRVTGNFYVGIMLEAATECVIESCQVEDVKNRGIYIYQSGYDHVISNCYVDGGALTDYGYNFNGAGVGVISRVRVIGCTAYNCAEDGFVVADDLYYLSMVGCVADVIGNTGFLIELANGGRPQYNTFSGCVAHSCVVYGFQIVDTYYNNLSGCEAVACGTGYYFNTAQYNSISSSRADASTTAGSQPGHGFRFNGSAHRNDLNGIAAQNCAGTGILLDSGASINRITGRAYNNTTANLTDNGTGTVKDVTVT